MKSSAEKLAQKLGAESLSEAHQICAVRASAIVRSSEGIRYAFKDNSVITFRFDGNHNSWDLGFPNCFCYRSDGHRPDCSEGCSETGKSAKLQTALAAVTQELRAQGESFHRALEELQRRVAQLEADMHRDDPTLTDGPDGSSQG